jgi:hypothetical protein
MAFWVAGGQWMALQSMAWLNMTRTYCQTETLSRSLAKTFDGNHPCPLCRFIQKEKAAQSSPKVISNFQKNSFFFISFTVLLVLLLAQPKLHSIKALLSEFDRSPLSPPPRKFFSI